MGTEELERELRAGLEGVTPGPWVHYCAPLRHGMNVINEIQCGERAPVVSWSGFDDSFRSKARHKKNATHIARCSPENIRALLDTIASLRTKLAHLREIDSSEQPRYTTKRLRYEIEEARKRDQAEIASLHAKVAGLEQHIQLHAGDAQSLNNEVELFRQHWNEAEAEAASLRADLAEAMTMVNAATAWWEDKRPLDWDVAKHIGCPAVNCSGVVEGNVARAAAEYWRKKTDADR
jgi:hypothetical protein